MTRLEKCELAVEKGFTYNSETGQVKTPLGKIVINKTVNGYLRLSIWHEKHRFSLLCHQFAYFILYNEIVDCIDHINRIKTDNKPENLRSVTKSQNAMNMSGEKGVSLCKRTNKWQSYIMLNYKKKFLGSFETKDKALKCYLENKEKYHIIN